MNRLRNGLYLQFIMFFFLMTCLGCATYTPQSFWEVSKVKVDFEANNYKVKRLGIQATAECPYLFDAQDAIGFFRAATGAIFGSGEQVPQTKVLGIPLAPEKVDLLSRAMKDFHDQAKSKQLTPIMLVAPTTKFDRLKKIARAGAGFIYAVARAGVTGKQTRFEDNFIQYIQRCRDATDLPLAVGFGIKEKQDLEYLSSKVEIGIIGTALLQAWEKDGERGLRMFFEKIKI